MAVYPLLDRRFLIIFAISVVFCIPLRKNGSKRIYITNEVGFKRAEK